MPAKRLENAAQAAGFAMVNPEDFAHEAAPVPQVESQLPQKPVHTTTAIKKSWFAWDPMRLMGGKATA